MRTDVGWLLVDSDTTLIAAPDRDLWMMGSGDVPAIDAYEAATGRHVLQVALDCYRLWWDLSEICEYVTLLRDNHDDTDDTRESWNNLQHYLDPQCVGHNCNSTQSSHHHFQRRSGPGRASTMWLSDEGGRHGGEADGFVDPGDGGISGGEEHGTQCRGDGRQLTEQSGDCGAEPRDDAASARWRHLRVR